MQIERERAKKRAVELGLDEADRVKVKPKFRSDHGLIQGKGAVARQQAAAAAAAAATGKQQQGGGKSAAAAAADSDAETESSWMHSTGWGSSLCDEPAAVGR